jgi:colanic acid/amylovoran biosynthesis protein WcaK/AmsJ
MFGASPDTGNMGVSALWHSAASGLAINIQDLDLTVFDMMKGVRAAKLNLGDREIDYRRIGANHSRRYYRPDCLWNMRLAARVGGKWNPGVEAIRASDAVVDVSGGDSFADLYGSQRFSAIAQHKLIALEHGARLILLPQTYGPFDMVENRQLAERIVRNSTMAWARDPRSFVALQELLGGEFDAERHRSGVDMAFGLMTYEPVGRVTDPVRSWLERQDEEILVGINVSGLLYGKYEANAQVFGFKAEYSSVVHELTRRLLEDERVRVVLIPHVHGVHESDDAACAVVERALDGHGSGRLTTLPSHFDQSEVKWVISQLDWFCGTRMHSAIAGLSSGVPTSAIAYSLKTQGVFETCDQGDHVADPRDLDTLDVIDKLEHSYRTRAEAKTTLARRVPEVKALAAQQMRVIAECASSVRRTPELSSP